MSVSEKEKLRDATRRLASRSGGARRAAIYVNDATR